MSRRKYIRAYDPEKGTRVDIGYLKDDVFVVPAYGYQHPYHENNNGYGVATVALLQAIEEAPTGFVSITVDGVRKMFCPLEVWLRRGRVDEEKTYLGPQDINEENEELEQDEDDDS